jgi:hypothetical protein
MRCRSCCDRQKGTIEFRCAAVAAVTLVTVALIVVSPCSFLCVALFVASSCSRLPLFFLLPSPTAYTYKEGGSSKECSHSHSHTHTHTHTHNTHNTHNTHTHTGIGQSNIRKPIPSPISFFPSFLTGVCVCADLFSELAHDFPGSVGYGEALAPSYYCQQNSGEL